MLSYTKNISLNDITSQKRSRRLLLRQIIIIIIMMRIIIDNFYIALFSDVHKLTALYKKHCTTFTNQH